MRRIVLFVISLTMLFALAGCGRSGENAADALNPEKTSDSAETETPDERDIVSLKEQYPEYFELSDLKGIEIFVWKTAGGTYRCGLMSGTNRMKTAPEIRALEQKSLSVAEAKAVLEELGVENDRIVVLPITQPYTNDADDTDISQPYIINGEYAEEIYKLFATGTRPQAEDGPDNGQAAPVREDVCELYLEVLEDLWNVDPGLNDGIIQIGIDLSALSHLTEAEKDAVMSEFASKRGLPYVAGTWEELCEQGYIDKADLYWEDGLFFSIETIEDAVSDPPAGEPAPELTSFNAHKWRSGLGAFFYGQCTAQKDADGKWSYAVGYIGMA